MLQIFITPKHLAEISRFHEPEDPTAHQAVKQQLDIKPLNAMYAAVLQKFYDDNLLAAANIIILSARDHGTQR